MRGRNVMGGKGIGRKLHHERLKNNLSLGYRKVSSLPPEEKMNSCPWIFASLLIFDFLPTDISACNAADASSTTGRRWSTSWPAASPPTSASSSSWRRHSLYSTEKIKLETFLTQMETCVSFFRKRTLVIDKKN